jgi:hypothetical protein
VVALVSEGVISLGLKVSQDTSAAKIAHSLDDHHKRLILVFSLCVLYAVGFVMAHSTITSCGARAARDGSSRAGC